MNWFKDEINLNTQGQGLYDITDQINSKLSPLKIDDGFCIIQIMHTSASLIITENSDQNARIDIQNFMDHIAPENQSWHKHILEGTEDSPSHMKSVITQTSLNLIIEKNRLDLGHWQGIYLFEHRHGTYHRQIKLRFFKAD